VTLVSPVWAPDPLMVGIRSPDGLVVGLAPATLEFWVRFPNERNQGKAGRHPVLKYRFLIGPNGYIGLGVPIGTDAFIQHFVDAGGVVLIQEPVELARLVEAELVLVRQLVHEEFVDKLRLLRVSEPVQRGVAPDGCEEDLVMEYEQHEI
jgi:hypothetical protein